MLTFDSTCLLIITVLAVLEFGFTCFTNWKSLKKALPSKKKKKIAKQRFNVVAGGKNNS